MSLTTEEDLVKFVKDLMGSSYEKVSNDGFKRAAFQAQAELHWTFPVTDSFKEFWLVERTKRFVTNILLFESAHKFQYKKINLQHRFKHYFQLLEMMDKDFKEALENNPETFDVTTWPNLSFYLTSGFQYDLDGEDMTYL